MASPQEDRPRTPPPRPITSLTQPVSSTQTQRESRFPPTSSQNSSASTLSSTHVSSQQSKESPANLNSLRVDIGSTGASFRETISDISVVNSALSSYKDMPMPHTAHSQAAAIAQRLLEVSKDAAAKNKMSSDSMLPHNYNETASEKLPIGHGLQSNIERTNTVPLSPQLITREEHSLPSGLVNRSISAPADLQNTAKLASLDMNDMLTRKSAFLFISH